MSDHLTTPGAVPAFHHEHICSTFDWSSAALAGSKRKRKKPPKPIKHRWFDGWIAAKADRLKTIVQEIADQVEDYEHREKLRKRARRAGDRMLHLERIELVVCKLAYAVLMPPQTGRIATSLTHGAKGRSRYDNPAIGKPLSLLLYCLWDLGVLDRQAPGAPRGETTSIAPSAPFAELVRSRGICLEDFERCPHEETILLSRRSRTRASRPGGARTRTLVDYSDNHTTLSCRADLLILNDTLRSADIRFVDDGLLPKVDPNVVTLRRHFVLLDDQEARFDQSGRLFGGFWQGLSRSRRKHIRIDGQPVVELDYGQMFTRLAYAEIGRDPPDGDVYAIPGLEGYRRGVKLALNTLLFDSHGRRSQWPPELGVGVGSDAEAVGDDYEAYLPAGYGVAKTKKAILKVHPHLKAAWGRGLGYRLMFLESEILMAVLLKLLEEGIVALGLHDGLIVGKPKKETALSVMKDTSLQRAGLAIPVAVKM